MEKATFGLMRNVAFSRSSAKSYLLTIVNVALLVTPP
jgi:hypothetical protein